MNIGTARNAGEALKQARLAAAMTQAELAGRIHVSRKWVIDVESGANTSFHFDTYLKAIQVLGGSITIGGASESQDGQRQSAADDDDRDAAIADYFNRLRNHESRYESVLGGA